MNMLGQSNFKAASDELDCIAQLMDYNQTQCDNHNDMH